MGAGEVVGGVFLRLGFCGGVFVTRVGGCRIVIVVVVVEDGMCISVLVTLVGGGGGSLLIYIYGWDFVLVCW